LAKAHSKAPKQEHCISEEIALKFHELIRRIDVVESMAACVLEALLGRRNDPDQMLAVCVEHNIADELSRISQSAAALMLELGHEPRSLILGALMRPTRKGDVRPRP
jgi:hypothetical protein